VLLHGKDRGGVRERADILARVITPDLNDPFNVAMLTETDLDQPGRLEEELTALSMMGGRRLVRLRLTGERAAPDKTAAEALVQHAEGQLNPDGPHAAMPLPVLGPSLESSKRPWLKSWPRRPGELRSNSNNRRNYFARLHQCPPTIN
jgi:hypothetical protein